MASLEEKFRALHDRLLSQLEVRRNAGEHPHLRHETLVG